MQLSKIKPLLLAQIMIDTADSAGAVVKNWLHSERAQSLSQFNILATQHTRTPDPVCFSWRLQIWCDNYDPDDLTLARLAGLF